MICNPMGRPPEEYPQGTEIEGSPPTLASKVQYPNANEASASLIRMGSVGRVGDTTTSNSEKALPTSRRNAPSAARSSPISTAGRGSSSFRCRLIRGSNAPGEACT